MAYERELAVCLEAVRAAGHEILRLDATLAKLEDAPADISTLADKASQEIILRTLLAAFPDDRLCGEERTDTLADAAARELEAGARLWVVDPIDGTRGFAVKNGEYSVMVGLTEAGRVVLGAVHEPALDRLTYAVRNAGCWTRQPWDAAPRRCQATVTNRMADATVAMSRSRKEASAARLLAIFGASRAVKTYSAGVKLAQVARGEADLYLGDYPALRDWDVCAGHILVEEAGGIVTDCQGVSLRYGGDPPTQAGGVLATNGPLHADALAAVRSAPDGLYG